MHPYLPSYLSRARALVIIGLMFNTYLLNAQYTISKTYNSGHIPTSFNDYDPTCAVSSTLDINLPLGASILVTSVDIEYDMTSVIPYWKSNQRSQIHCITTDSTEAMIFQGVGNFPGDENYTRTGVDIADGTYPGSTSLSFEMRAWRTVDGGEPDPCNTEIVRVKNLSWTITVHYDIDYDGDGYFTILDGDCDDFDPDVYPDAVELCDLKDNDCDGLIDEGTTVISLTWNGSASNDWNDASNWTPSSVPDYCSDVTIPNGHTVEINAFASARTIEVMGSSTLTNNATLQVGYDAGINYALDIHGTFDNSLGNLFVVGTNNGIRSRTSSTINCGYMAFNDMATTAVINEGNFISGNFDYLEVNNSQAVSNFGTMSLQNIFANNLLHQNSIVNDATLIINTCGNGEVNGLLSNNGSFTQNGFITWNADVGSSNTNSFINNGFIRNNDGTVTSVISTNNGWAIEEINTNLCYEDPLSPIFSGLGTHLEIVSNQVLLSDYSTVAGVYNDLDNSILFNNSAVGDSTFVIQVENTADLCSYYFEIALTNPVQDLNTYYRDEDQDGYGDLLITMDACSPPVGFVDNDLDCNDDNENIYPDAPELCDGLDNDCDFDIDEGAPNSTNIFFASTDNLWSNPNNWSLAVIPYPCHDVVIPFTEGCNADIFINANSIEVLGTLELNSGGIINGTDTFGIRNNGVVNFNANAFFFNGVAGYAIHNLGFMTVEAGVYLDAANASNMGDYLLYLDGSSIMINAGTVLFPSVDIPNMSNGNSGLGIYIGNSATLTNDTGGGLYTMQNALRPMGLLENHGCICAGYNCILSCN